MLDQRRTASARTLFSQELLERVLVCRKKELVLHATGSLFGRDDVQQARGRNLVRSTSSSFGPVARVKARRATIRSEPAIARAVERLIADPQFQTSIIAACPRLYEVVGIGGKKEVTIVGLEHDTARVRPEVRATHADCYVFHVPLIERPKKRDERIHGL